jgi:dienelactone hydrolase
VEEVVAIGTDRIFLEGVLNIPSGARGLVLFAHGSGSSRHSPRNIFVARALNAAGLGTLLFDLMTRQEDTIYQSRFDIDLLAGRLVAATRWAQEHEQTATMKIGYFGASTGAAAALKAAAMMPDNVHAVVSRGGRPDLAGPELPRVLVPVLLIVGGADEVVIGLNHEAYIRLGGVKKMEIIPGASHLFEEPGTLEEVARLAAEWFTLYLGGHG